MNTIRTSVVLAVAFVGLVAGSAHAQQTVVVKVPFPFVVRGHELPAGQYDITSDNGVLAIRGADNRSEALALTQPADGRDPVGDQPAVVFVRYENQTVLSQVWSSESNGIALASRAGHHPEITRQSSIVLTPVSVTASSR